MTFYNYFRTIFALLMVMAGISSAAKAGKITYRIGEPELYTSGKGTPKKIQINMKVRQSDRIRTKIEEQVVIGLYDGSSVSIEENSIIDLSELLSEDGTNKFTAEIKSGRMKFDIQKQSNAQSSIKFKTGTATAAIRGTDGIIGVSRRGKPIASLRSGKMDLEMGGEKASISGGQAVVTLGEKFVIIDLENSGDSKFMNDLDSLVSDTTLTADLIVQKAKQLDEISTSLREKAATEIKCNVSAIPDTILEPKITIEASCTPGVDFIVSGIRDTLKQDSKKISIGWEQSVIGMKKFETECIRESDKTSIHCGTLSTFYKQIPLDTTVIDTTKKDSATHVKLQLNNNTIEVCKEGKAVISGKFDPSDSTASLEVTIGKTSSENLVYGNPTGEFTYTATVNDQKGNWNEKTAKVVYKSNLYNEEETVNLEIGKHCSDVNLHAPTIKLVSSDSVSCKAKLEIRDSKGDIVLYRASSNSNGGSWSAPNSNGFAEIKLGKGLHDYTFEVEDLAKNRSRITKTLGCYPKNARYSISYSGKKIEHLRIPPPPQGITSSAFKILHFKIDGLFQNNPIFIKQIIITQAGKMGSTILKGSQLSDNSFDYQVELPLDKKKTTITITAEMKNGSVVTATKVYEVN